MEQILASDSSKHEQQRGNAQSAEYIGWVSRIRHRVADAKGPVFQTDARELVWDAYLTAFPEASRQYHNCTACRRFIRNFGALATVSDSGALEPLFWLLDDAPAEERESVAAMIRVVQRAKIVSPFTAREFVLGNAGSDTWIHLCVPTPGCAKHTHSVHTPFQLAAERIQDLANVRTALQEFTLEVCAKAKTLLESDALYRSEKVLGQAEFLLAAHSVRSNTNLLWRLIASSPPGFCHPRSSMIGTLLEDIAAGKSGDDVARSFAAKMHPLRYQRPQVAPTEGNIKRGEELVEKLGIAKSLERRFARLEELQLLWSPTQAAKPQGGVFSHLRPKETPDHVTVSKAQPITWARFERDVLPKAKRIECLVPSRGNFRAILTAQHPDAPPIHQWDSSDARNPCSSYVYHGGSYAYVWSVQPGWIDVVGIALDPALWHDPKSHHGWRAIFVLPGCVDTNTGQGNALFPESLRAELREIRATIEAYSRRAEIGGRAEASACGLSFDGAGSEITVRVDDGSGVLITYKLDRKE